MIVSELDIKHLQIIRANVSNFIRDCSGKYDTTGTSLLDIAPQEHLGAKEFFHLSSVYTLDINPTADSDYIADICETNDKTIPDNHFDYVLCTEVLEHTLRPFDAVNELRRILKPEGLIFVSVPFNFRIHGPLPDCWRFTDHGLRSLFSNFQILELNAIETPERNLMPVHYTLVAKKS